MTKFINSFHFSGITENFDDSACGARLRKRKEDKWKEEPRVIDGKINKFH